MPWLPVLPIFLSINSFLWSQGLPVISWHAYLLNLLSASRMDKYHKKGCKSDIGATSSFFIKLKRKKKNEWWYQSPAWSQRNLWIMQGNGLLAGCRVLQERASGGAGEQDQLRAVIWSTALFWRSAEFILPLSEGETAKDGLQVYYGKGIK